MHEESKLFAEVALRLGFIEREELRRAFEQADKRGIALGRWLLERDLLSQAQVLEIAKHVRHLSTKDRSQPEKAATAVARDGVNGSQRVEQAPSDAARAHSSNANHSSPQTPQRDARERHSPGTAEPYLNKALAYAMSHGASDLHAHAGAELMLRIHGNFQPLKAGRILSAADSEMVIAEIVMGSDWQALLERGQVDFAYEVAGLGRFRVNAYRQERGFDIVFRLIPPTIPSLAELGLPNEFGRFIDFRTGLVLCTGPVGCGKTTSLAALLQLLITTRAEHVITLENPIEFVFPPGKALVNQRQVGTHTDSFARALRGALREDPDVIAITELRDRESISLALSAAETGHLVMGTLHTGNAAQTINRIVNAFPPKEQPQVRSMLSESLRVVISQRLIPRADGRGRACAYEVLICTPAVANLIREDKTTQLGSVMQTGRSQGMLMLDDSLAALLKQGLIDTEQARRFCVDRGRFGAATGAR